MSQVYKWSSSYPSTFTSYLSFKLKRLCEELQHTVVAVSLLLFVY